LCCPKLSANLRELAVGQRLGEDAAVDESESVPFGGTFGLEVPEDPSISVALESLKLGLDEAAHVVLESLRPGLHEVDAVAAAVVGAAGVSAVVTGSIP